MPRLHYSSHMASAKPPLKQEASLIPHVLSLVFKPNVAPLCPNKGNLSPLTSSSFLHCLVQNQTLHFTVEVFIIYVLNFNLYHFFTIYRNFRYKYEYTSMFFKMLFFFFLDSTACHCFIFGPGTSLLQEKNSFLLQFPHSNSVQFSHSLMSDSL